MSVHPQRTQRKLRAIGDGGDETKLAKATRALRISMAQPPRKERRTSGSASSAFPVSVKRFAPWTST